MTKTINSKKLRLNLKEILKLTEAGMEFDITYRSKKVACLSPIENKKDQKDTKTFTKFLDDFNPDIKAINSKSNLKDSYYQHLDKKYD